MEKKKETKKTEKKKENMKKEIKKEAKTEAKKETKKETKKEAKTEAKPKTEAKTEVKTDAKAENAPAVKTKKRRSDLDKVRMFASNLTRLRKERGISQKKAAEELGLSQALLSHYEKGIRECGLDFIIKCSKYYGVTTDYILGVTENRNGFDMTIVPDFDEVDEIENAPSETMLQASIMLLNMIKATNDPQTIRYVYDYYILCLYRGALNMAKAGILPKELFDININVARELASAAISFEDARLVFMEDKSRTGTDLTERTALHQVIAKAEDIVLDNFILND